MKRRTLLGAALSACVPGVARASEGDYRQYYSLMRPGQIFRGDTIAFDLNLVVVPNSTQLLQVLGDKRDWSKEANPIFQALKAGKIPAFRGQTTATYYLNLIPEHLPRRLFYLNAMRCQGMVEVQRSGIAGYSQATIPVMEGGLAELIVPRSCMERSVTDARGFTTSVVPVVQLGMRALKLPEITDGVFRGWHSTLISRPSGIPGVSHAAERARARHPDGKVMYPGVLYPFVVDAGGFNA
jgi:hypothetical protein